MMAKEKVGLFGGTFNPVHNGHLTCARIVRQHLGLARVIFIPTAIPVHRPAPNLLSGEHRLQMCRLAIETSSYLQASDIEVHRTEPSYTVITLQELCRRTEGACDFYIIIGSDNLHLLHTWKDIDIIFDLCHIVTVPRAGYPQSEIHKLQGKLRDEQVQQVRKHWVPMPLIDISATHIRELATAGEPIGPYVPESVADYIVANRLYT